MQISLPEPLHRGQKLNWNFPVSLIGEKVTDPVIHSCELCDLPIIIYGRVLPCKHVFCFECAGKSDKTCPRCKDPVNRIERCELGTIFMCTWGAPRHSQEGCRRTYLSHRDLQAHVNHRHANSTQSKPALTSPAQMNASSNSGMISLSNVPQHKPETVQLSVGIDSVMPGIVPTHSAAHRHPAPQHRQQSGTRGNLITIQLQGENIRSEQRRMPPQRPTFR